MIEERREKIKKEKEKKRTKRETHGICVLKFEFNNVIRKPKHGLKCNVLEYMNMFTGFFNFLIDL